MTAPDLKPTFYFDRYINGVKMAEDVCVERASSLSAAMVIASKIASRGPNGEAPVLVYRPTPLAEALAVPEIAALVRAATAFHSACNAAWAAGEPPHRVLTMLDAADLLDAALRAIGEGRNG